MTTPDKIEELARRLRKAENHYAVSIRFRASYGLDYWHVRINSALPIEFHTFEQLEAWVDGRVKGGKE